MSRGDTHLKESQREIILEALSQSAKRMEGQYPAITLIEQLCTESEKIALGRRILIAQMILAGEKRMDIQNKLGVSPNTITLTRKWLSGHLKAYDQITKVNKAEEAARKKERHSKNHTQRKEYVDPLSFIALQRKYPAHFLLFNLAEDSLRRLN